MWCERLGLWFIMGDSFTTNNHSLIYTHLFVYDLYFYIHIMIYGVYGEIKNFLSKIRIVSYKFSIRHVIIFVIKTVS